MSSGTGARRLLGGIKWGEARAATANSGSEALRTTTGSVDKKMKKKLFCPKNPLTPTCEARIHSAHIAGLSVTSVHVFVRQVFLAPLAFLWNQY